jgi:hypothetical protein
MYELFDPRHVQCWHVTASPVSLHFSGRGIAPVAKQFWQWVVCCKWQLHGHTTFCDSPKIIVLILDVCRIGTLLHLLCHCTSYVFGLIPWWNNFDSGWLIVTDNCNAIPSVVGPTILIEWWELASYIVTAMLPFGTFPRISCLILDNWSVGTLLHLLCLASSTVVGLLPWWNNFDGGWPVANDNCTAFPSVIVPLGGSCSILVWCSVGMIHQCLCPHCSRCWIAPWVEQFW